MKLENIEIAQTWFKSLKDINHAIKGAEIMVKKCTSGESCIHMSEHCDHSGDFNLSIIYDKDGNYDSDLYTLIALNTLSLLQDRKLYIENKISAL